MKIVHMFNPVKRVNCEQDHVDQAIVKIQLMGWRLKLVTLVLALTGLFASAYVIFFGRPETMLQLPHGIHLNYEKMVNIDWFIIGLIAFLRPLAYMPVLWCLYRLFRLYEDGIVFSETNIRWIQYTGYALIAIDVVVILQSIITGPVLTSLGVVKPYFSVSIVSSFLIVGLFIIFIAQIMALALALKDERDLTV